jgi:hypothetical protein
MDTKTKNTLTIDITAVIGQLEAMKALTRNEFSGFGWGTWEGGNVFKVQRVEVLDVRTFGYTEISPEKVAAVMRDPEAVNARVWFHAHPLGDARHPGPQNWSGMDHATARSQRMYYAATGQVQYYGWTIAIVRTPNGWTGRLDTFGQNAGTTYCAVCPNPALDLFDRMQQLAAESAAPEPQNAADEEEFWDDAEERLV